jgi:hypothetical protein
MGRDGARGAVPLEEEDDARAKGAASYPLQKVTTPTGVKSDSHAGKLLAHCVDRLGESELGERVGDTDPQFLRGQDTTVDQSFQLVSHRQKTPAALHGSTADIGQGERAFSAVDERCSDSLLEPLDPPGHRRLSQVKLSRRSTDRSRLDHCDEGSHVIAIHNMHTIYVHYSFATCMSFLYGGSMNDRYREMAAYLMLVWGSSSIGSR